MLIYLSGHPAVRPIRLPGQFRACIYLLRFALKLTCQSEILTRIYRETLIKFLFFIKCSHFSFSNLPFSFMYFKALLPFFLISFSDYSLFYSPIILINGLKFQYNCPFTAILKHKIVNLLFYI